MNKETENITYSEAMAQLETIVEKMQSNQCSIDNLNDLTKKSLELLKICKEKLTATDEQLQKILSEISDD